MYNIDYYYYNYSYPYYNNSDFAYVVSYELYANGNYDLKYSNSTVESFAYQVVDNATATERRWWGSNFELSAYWSPEYWNNWDASNGYGLYWSGTAWTLGSYERYYYAYDMAGTNSSSVSSLNTTFDNSTLLGLKVSTKYSNYSYTDYYPYYNYSYYTNSSYPYTYISGIQDYEYDFTQGGYRKYKEDAQNDLHQAYMAEPYDSICDPRNQMIIIGDLRIAGANSVGVATDSSAKAVTLLVESQKFVPDNTAFSASLTASIFMLIASVTIMLF